MRDALNFDQSDTIFLDDNHDIQRSSIETTETFFSLHKSEVNI